MDGNASSKRRLNKNKDDVTNSKQKGKELESQLFGDEDDLELEDMILFIDPVSLGFGNGLPQNHYTSRSNDCRKIFGQRHFATQMKHV